MNETTQQLRSPAVFAEDEFSSLDAVAQADLVRSRSVSPRELAEAALRRIGLVNPQINAIAALDAEQALKRADACPLDAPLAGVPTLIKDLLPYPGLPISYGSRALRGNIAASGSEYTDALDRAGLNVLGMSCTSELGFLGTTETLAYGATRNPWDLRRSPGGSSGGAVAAVASGMVPIAHATDGGGSIRGPASFTGLFGFKPSRGLTLPAGQAAQSPLGVVLSDHCVSRTVRDSAAWLRATMVNRPAQPSLSTESRKLHPPKLRIGVTTNTPFVDKPDPDVMKAFARVLALCEDAGHELVEVSIPGYDPEAASAAFFSLMGGTAAGLFAYLKGAMGDAFSEQAFEPFTREIAQRFGQLDSPNAVQAALDTLHGGGTRASHVFSNVDVLMSPTTAFTAPLLGQTTGESSCDEVVRFTNRVAAYTALASIAGWCAMTMPLVRSVATGLPIGTHFAAPQGADQRLFELAFQLETMSPWL